MLSAVEGHPPDFLRRLRSLSLKQTVECAMLSLAARFNRRASHADA